MNKADHLEPTELEEVRGFIGAAVRQALGVAPDLYCVSLRARAGEWDRFSAAFERFVRVELAEARLGVARAELGRIGEDLRDAVLSRRAGLISTSRRCRSGSSSSARRPTRNARPSMRTVCCWSTMSARSMAEVGESLAAFRRAEPSRWRERLQAEAESLSIGKLEDGLRTVVEQSVRESFEAFRVREAERVEAAWSALAAGSATQRRVDAVRAAANDLFAIELPAIVVPAVSEERESFFYLFLHVGSTSEGLERGVRRLLPHRVVRRRMLARANELMVREFDKHAGRARWDLTQRLDGVRRRFEEAMSAELQRTVDAMAVSAFVCRSASFGDARRPR